MWYNTTCEEQSACFFLLKWGGREVLPESRPRGVGGGNTLDFKRQGWSNGGRNQNPKKSLDQNLTPKIPCWISEPSTFPESIKWYDYHESLYCFEYPKKSLLKSSYPKNAYQNFPTQKDPEIENFKPKKILPSSLWRSTLPGNHVKCF